MEYKVEYEDEHFPPIKPIKIEYSELFKAARAEPASLDLLSMLLSKIEAMNNSEEKEKENGGEKDEQKSHWSTAPIFPEEAMGFVKRNFAEDKDFEDTNEYASSKLEDCVWDLAGICGRVIENVNGSVSFVVFPFLDGERTVRILDTHVVAFNESIDLQYLIESKAAFEKWWNDGTSHRIAYLD